MYTAHIQIYAMLWVCGVCDLISGAQSDPTIHRKRCAVKAEEKPHINSIKKE